MEKENLSSFFNNLVITELASVLAGPLVGNFFAELGASVIKIENPKTQGDVTRTWALGNEEFDDGISSYFSAVNWGKKSITLDIKNRLGRDVFYDLVKKSDVVITNLLPHSLKALKIDYEHLSNVNSQLIFASISGYGANNSRKGYDGLIQAESGLMSINGYKNGEPLRIPIAYNDILTAHQLIEGILIALLQRQLNGTGTSIEVSLFHGAISSLMNQATNYLVGKKVPYRAGSEHPNISPYGTAYECSDKKEIILAIGDDQQFFKLCEVLNIKELASDPRFKTNDDRIKHRQTLIELLKKTIKTWNSQALLDQLHKKGVLSGKVNTIEEALKIEEAEEIIINGKTSSGREIMGIKKSIFQLNGIGSKQNLLPPPRLGEHTIEILKEVLEYSDEKNKQLLEQAAILET